MPNSTQQSDFDLQQWLADINADNSLTKEQVESLSTILGNDKVQPKLRDQVLMRRDYSRKTQELANERRQLEADVNSVLSERADLAAWKKDVDAKLSKAYSDLDSARMTQAQFEARIQTIAEQTGLDVADLRRGLPAAAAATSTAVVDAGGKPNGTAAIDPAKYVSAEDYNRSMRQLPLLNAQVEDIFSEHQELTGKPLKFEYTDSGGKKWTGRTALLVKATELNSRPGAKPISVRDVWEQDFNIPAVRQQQLEASIEARVTEKLDAAYKTKLSEQLVNGGTPGRTTPLADRPKSTLFDEKRDHRTPAERELAAANGDKPHHEPPPTSAATREERWQRAASGYVNRRAAGVPLGQDIPAKGEGAL